MAQILPPSTKMKPKQKLAKQLEIDVRELCQPCGRRVGTKGHQLAEQWVEQRLQKIGCIPYRENSFSLPYQVEGIGFKNFAGVIPGKNRNLPPVLIGAHYDSVIDAPCADDNGASVAISLAVADAIAQNGGLEHDLLVAIFDAEEPPYFQGECMGSIRFYEDQIDVRGIHFAVISDLVGHDITFPKSVTKRLPAAKLLTSPFAPLTFMTGAESHPELLNMLENIDTPKGMKLIATLNEYVGDMSDHGIFRLNDIPYVFLSCGRWEHYHQPSDTPEKLNYQKMGAITEYCIRICRAGSKTSFSETEMGADSLNYEIKTWRTGLGLMRRPLAKMLGISDFNNRQNIDTAAMELSNLGL
ncbi:M28 family peptidase [Akkermansiaceae bacterium]|nr:M28 family peptidase [Akkermansiaceae bacterium]